MIAAGIALVGISALIVRTLGPVFDEMEAQEIENALESEARDWHEARHGIPLHDCVACSTRTARR